MPKSQRKSQIVVPGLGQHYTSPKKAAPRRPTVLRPLGHDLKKRRLTDELNRLLANPGATITAVPDTAVPDVPSGEHDDRAHNASDALDNLAAQMITNMDMDPPTPRGTAPPPPKASGEASSKLYSSWASLLPTLVEPLLEYERQSIGKPLTSPSSILRGCTNGRNIDCEFRTLNMLCLFPDHFRMLEVQGCKCQTIPQRLVTHGLFPTSPAQPRIAISIDLLNLFHSLFEESCDAVHAMSHALKKYYLRRGYMLTSNQTGDEVKEPFRRSLGYAMQWHDTLRLLSAISTTVEPHNTSSPPDISSELPNEVLANHGIDQAPSLPARELQIRCPACFGGDKFGVPFSEGGDFHVAVDGNFHHRHRRSAGDSARFHKPEYFLSKEQVDRVGVHIHKARKGKPKEIRPVVPNEAIDQCKQSHDAANDNKAKSNVEQFDDHGISALVCRHGAPLFTTNIDTPGEQQKYAVALIQHLFRRIPDNSTVLVLYDVGCVLNRSMELYDIFPPDITARLEFATSAMHAYAHQWSCQLVYNPRLREGVGLTDGEGVERLWSRLRKLIGITRTSGRSRRIWLVDRQLNSIGSSHREDLGDWLTRRYAFAQKESRANETVVRNSGFTVKELQHEWALQREAQLSLDSILNLQSELDSLDTTIEATKKALSKGTTPLASRLLPELTLTGEKLRTQADQIYDTLNVQNRFPELKQCSLEFVRILLILRDLKVNIRKRAIGSFFEWDKLDQAVGGRQQSIGTKLHQRTRNAITKRRPALLTAINKFNALCGTLERLHDPTWLVPLPKPLPTQLSGLRDAQELMEDVWITPSDSAVPRWLENLDVRNGIRSMQKIHRCTEETVRLHREAENMCLWLTAESAAVRQALTIPRHKNLLLRLEQYLASIERLEARWACSLISRKRLRGILDQSRPNPTRLTPPSTPSNQGTFTTSVDCSIEADYPKDDDEVLADEARFLEPEAIILSDILDNAEDASDDGLETEVTPIEAPVSLCHSEHTRTPRADQDNDIKPLVKHSDLTDRHHIALNKDSESTVSGRLASIHWALPVSVRCFFHLVRVY
ncbi:hypothetical protein PC9H_000194 [Pleurotus ostreatus]|uniref:CxC1-like cysteine cluster associated with KDZ transposases domain-containing protein n=1 Tax=Pleurotus ostreatus TaxID=5322 RepID=A0A8H7A395_PLEOS|nr:uncharacterized protein PC9H_000194 [Pleurotus ostreatus]KAF7439857.1 hypothetical protein PC9H_000194 [Pleurotus ostreatus]